MWRTRQERFGLPLLLSCHVGSAFGKCYRSILETPILPIRYWIIQGKQLLNSLHETRKELEKSKTYTTATIKNSVQCFSGHRLPLRLIGGLFVPSCPWHRHHLWRYAAACLTPVSVAPWHWMLLSKVAAAIKCILSVCISADCMHALENGERPVQHASD